MCVQRYRTIHDCLANGWYQQTSYFYHNHNTQLRNTRYIITKPSESGVLCGNITDFGVAEVRWSSATQNKVILPHITPDEGCFVIMLYYSYSFIYPYLTASVRWQNWLKRHGIGGEITSNFFVFKCFDQLAPTVHNQTKWNVPHRLYLEQRVI